MPGMNPLPTSTVSIVFHGPRMVIATPVPVTGSHLAASFGSRPLAWSAKKIQTINVEDIKRIGGTEHQQLRESDAR